MSLLRYLLDLLASLLRGRERRLRVLSQSPGYLALNKDFDLVINSDDPERPSLYKQIHHTFPHLSDFGRFKVPAEVCPHCRDYMRFLAPQHGFRVLHRLDYATSGVVVVPLTKQFNRSASRALQQRLARKFYVALVRGHVSQSLVSVCRAIGEVPENELRMTCPGLSDSCQRPRDAETRLAVLSWGVYDGYPATKVLLRPVTGRRHQLRVHCTALGHRIVGDFTYAGARAVEDAPHRMRLHAKRIILPDGDESVDIEAEEGLDFWDGYVEVRLERTLDAHAYNVLSQEEKHFLRVT